MEYRLLREKLNFLTKKLFLLSNKYCDKKMVRLSTYEHRRYRAAKPQMFHAAKPQITHAAKSQIAPQG